MKDQVKKRLLEQLGVAPVAPILRQENVKRHQSPHKGFRCILVIDDEPSSVELAAAILEADGYCVHAASSVAEGKNILQGSPDISLIITDLRMPDETGFSLLEYLRDNNRFSQIPVIVMTCCSDRNIVMQAIETGAKGYVTKPFTSDLLLRRVGEIFERGKGNILLITDNNAAAAVLKRALEAENFKVYSVPNGKSAKELINHADFDIFICDLVLNDITGPDLMIAVQEIRGYHPFIFTENTNMDLSEEDIRAAGGYGLLKKPYNNSEIIASIHGIFSKTRSQ